MKISKSFKIYIHIIFAFFLCEYLYASSDFSKNIVIHDIYPAKENKWKDTHFYALVCEKFD